MVCPVAHRHVSPHTNMDEEVESHGSFDWDASAQRMANLFGLPFEEAQRLVAQASSMKEEGAALQGLSKAYAGDQETAAWTPGMGIGSKGTEVPMLFCKSGLEAASSGRDKRLVTAYVPSEEEVIACLCILKQDKDNRLERRIEVETRVFNELNTVSTPHLLAYYGKEERQNQDGSSLTVLYMEHARGSDALLPLEVRGTPLRKELLLLVMRCALETLAAAHEIGVSHRDIKPANIVFKLKPDTPVTSSRLEPLCTNLGHLPSNDQTEKILEIEKILMEQEVVSASLIDWGLARTRRSTPQEIAEFCGTYDYMAPDLFTDFGPNPQAKAADLYALGTTGFMLAYGTMVREPTSEFSNNQAWNVWKDVALSVQSLSDDVLKMQYCEKAQVDSKQWTHFDTLVFTMLSPAPDKRGTAQSHLDMVNRLGMTLFSPDHEPVKASHSRNGSYLCCTIS